MSDKYSGAHAMRAFFEAALGRRLSAEELGRLVSMDKRTVAQLCAEGLGVELLDRQV